MLLLGENLTQLTQSECPSSWMVYLHWARVFHSLMVLSLLADTICLLSTEKATDSTSLVWSSNLRVVFPVLRSHSLKFLSQEPERAKCPSEERTTSDTKWEWPWSLFWGTPYWPSSLVSFQTISDLSRLLDRIMSGYLGLVVIWVTQPLWPLRVPLNCRVSVILVHDLYSEILQNNL